MAKKKSNKIAPKKDSSKSVKKEESMLSKVEVKAPVDQEKISRIVGSIFIGLGLLLIGYGVFSFVKFSRNPEFDESLQAPSLSGTDVLTNSAEIKVKGLADGYSDVYVYVDNTEVGKSKVQKDGSFEYIYSVNQEGKYAVSVAGVKGFPKRVVSPQSDMRIVEVDRSAPELKSVKYPIEVGTSTFTLSGEVESGCKVQIKRGTDMYSTDCLEDGTFKITNISLEEGPNVYAMEIRDLAGNIKGVEEKIKVTYSKDSSVNGDAAVDENGLPVADGNLEDAMLSIFNNRLMFVFGIVALIALVTSSAVVVIKERQS